MLFNVDDIDFIRLVPNAKNGQTLDNFNKAYHTVTNIGFHVTTLRVHHHLLQTLKAFNIEHDAISAFEIQLGMYILTHLSRFDVSGAQAVLRQISAEDTIKYRSYPEIAREAYIHFINNDLDYTHSALVTFSKRRIQAYPEVAKKVVKIVEPEEANDDHLTAIIKLNFYFNYQMVNLTDILGTHLFQHQAKNTKLTQEQNDQLALFIKLLLENFLTGALIAPTFNTYIKTYNQVGLKPAPQKPALKLL